MLDSDRGFVCDLPIDRSDRTFGLIVGWHHDDETLMNEPAKEAFGPLLPVFLMVAPTTRDELDHGSSVRL